MAKKAKELEQTRGSFKMRGLVKNIDRDNAYEEGIQDKQGKHQGDTYRKLNIGLQTAPDNQVRLGMFSYEPEKVFMWDSGARKKNPEYKGERVEWEKYLEQKNNLKASGKAVLQARVGVEYDENDKLISEGMTSYEASELIFENVENEDSVYIEGDVSYSQFKNRNDEWVTGTNYNMNRLHLAKDDFDLDDEKYEVQNYYEQQFVYVTSEVDRDKNKLMVIGRVIDYHKNFVDTTFVVDFSEKAGEDQASMKKLAESIKKKFKFGDLVTIFGQILNQTVEVEVEEDDNLAGLGGKSQPSHAKTNKTYNREMTIDGILEWNQKYYTEEDFANAGLVEESKEDMSDEFGGKSKPKHDSVFDDEDDEDLDDLGDDLPF